MLLRSRLTLWWRSGPTLLRFGLTLLRLWSRLVLRSCLALGLRSRAALWTRLVLLWRGWPLLRLGTGRVLLLFGSYLALLLVDYSIGSL